MQLAWMTFEKTRRETAGPNIIVVAFFFLNLFYEHQEENIFFYRLIWDESTYNELILSDLWLLNCSFVQRDDNWVMNFYSVSFI